jgi:ABC-type branched-subunit amino acid transport system substrate-binding protein
MGFQPDYHTEAVIYAKHILANVKDPKIGVLHQNDDYGRDYLGGFKEGLGKENEGKIVKVVTFEATDPTVDSQIIQLKDSGANVFFNVSGPKAAAQGIRKAADIDWKPVQYLNNVSVSVAAVMKPAGFENAQGIITASYMMDATDKQWNDNEEMKTWRAWMDKHMPQANKADANHIYAYAVSYLMTETLKRCGDELTRANLIQQVPRAAAAARHHGEHQCDRLLSDPGRPAAALQGRNLGAVRRGHARRKQLGHQHAAGAALPVDEAARSSGPPSPPLSMVSMASRISSASNGLETRGMARNCCGTRDRSV